MIGSLTAITITMVIRRELNHDYDNDVGGGGGGGTSECEDESSGVLNLIKGEMCTSCWHNYRYRSALLFLFLKLFIKLE